MMKRVIIYLSFAVLGFLCTQKIIGQKALIDSLEFELTSVESDTNKVNLLKELCWLYKFSDTEKAIDYGLKAMELAEQLDYQKGIERASSNLQVVYTIKGDLNKSVEYYNICIKISEELDNQVGIATASNNLGIIYWNRGLYPKALDAYIKSLDITEKLGLEEKSAPTMTNIGLLYQTMDNDSLALEYYIKALHRFEKFDKKTGLASVLQNIGSIYSGQEEYDTAQIYYFKSLEIAKEIGDKDKQASTMFHLGLIYLKLEDYFLALEYYNHALEIHTELGKKSNIAQDYNCIADVYLEVDKFIEALDFAKKSLEISEENGYINTLKDASSTLAQAYAEVGDYKMAFLYHRKYVALKDSVFNKEKNKAINSLQANYELEKERDKNKILEQEKRLDEEEQRRLRALIVGGSFGFILVIILAIVLYRSNANKKKANKLLTSQKQQIENQKDEIEQKNKDITASITYAERIQKAILPKTEEIERVISDFFILFKPRDIVSGDFYWFSKVNDHKYVIAAVDCTGHGVPGAFMSFIGSDWLDRIVNTMGITEPDEILKQLNKGIITALRQHENTNEDGMDMALCTVDTKEKTVAFAGANNPLVCIINGEIEILKGSSFAIGGKGETKGGTIEKEYDKHVVKVNQGDAFYLFSDGYQDQFGGEKGKKFMRKSFYEVMLKIHKEKMNNQKKIFDETILSWMEDYEQIDDILLIGFKI